MKQITLVVLGVSLLGVAKSDVPSKPDKPIPIADLYERGVMGELGQPLGEVLTIEGVVVDGDDLMVHRLEGRLLLKVEVVQEKRLTNPPTLLFNPYLPRVKFGLKAGKRFKLVAYETGHYRGFPMKDGFKHVMPFATTGFGFEPSLVILKDLSDSK